MNFIPKNLVEFFPVMGGLDFSMNVIENLTAEDLRPHSQIGFLKLASNRLTSIDGELFKYNLYLNHVDFSDNQIVHIGNGLVDNLKNLNYINFQRNSCINTYANGRVTVVELAKTLSCQCPPKPDYCSKFYSIDNWNCSLFLLLNF